MSSVLTHIEDELSRHAISPGQSSEAQSSKEFNVVVDLEALADLECRATARQDYNGGAPSRSKETLIAESEQLCRSVASGLRIDQPRPAHAQSPAAEATVVVKQTAESTLGIEIDPPKSAPGVSTSNNGAPVRLGPASLAPTRDEPNSLTPAIIEQARLRIRDHLLRERTHHNSAELPAVNAQCGVKQTREEILSLSETDRSIQIDSTINLAAHPAAARVVAEPPPPRRTALVADVSRAAEPAECGPTRSVPPTWYRRIPVRVAAYLALLGLIFVGFKPFVTHAGADSSHRTLASPALKQRKANDARRPYKTDPGPTASRPAEARSGSGRGPFHAEIKAIKTSWISAAADGKGSLDKLLRKDETSEVEFSAVVLLTIGNAGGVEISLEGKPIGPIGPDDVPRLIELTPSGFRFLRLSKKQAF